MTLKYAYNQLGQRILDDRTMPDGNQLTRFSYNQRLELVKSVRDRGGCRPDEVHTYAYDLNHNWTRKDGVAYTNNLADQLLEVAGGGSLSSVVDKRTRPARHRYRLRRSRSEPPVDGRQTSG